MLYQTSLSILPEECESAWQSMLADACQSIFLERNPIFQERLEKYERLFSNVLNGSLGPTIQYWSIHIYMINRVHRDLMRAVRTNDVEGYIKILPSVIDNFFSLNHLNYARWGVLFLNQLQMAPNLC